MKKIIEKRVTTYQEMRDCCIKFNWFTKGNSDEYLAFMNKCTSYDDITFLDLQDIAKELIHFSEEREGLTVLDWMENVANYGCHIEFEEKEEIDPVVQARIDDYNFCEDWGEVETYRYDDED